MKIKFKHKFLLVYFFIYINITETKKLCPQPESILPCRCALKNEEIQIWCSHSNLPQIMEGVKSVEEIIQDPIDEFILENNQLPALPGKFFGNLRIMRLMLRYNGIERMSNGWLNQLELHLIEIFMVEPLVRSIPNESLHGLVNLEAITIYSEELKRVPDFSGLINLKYLNIHSKSLMELPPINFKHLPKLENIHLNGGEHLTRLEAGLFDNLVSLKTIDLSRNGINWIHLRSLYRLPNLLNLKLSDNKIKDAGMVGRVVKDLENLQKLRLDKNLITTLEEGSFVDLPMLTELYLNENKINEIHYGAFHRTPQLRIIYLQNNKIRKIHPESFMQTSGSGIESLYLNNNEIDHIEEFRSLLDSLPALKYLELSQNQLTEIPYGALRGHGTLEQLYLNDNFLSIIDRDALMAMPALRELRLRNNSLSDNLPMPFWNLPGLKGLDLGLNNFRVINSVLLSGLPSLRRFDISQNLLNVIDRNAFKNTLFLETLNVSYNEIQDISSSTLQNLNKLFEVDISFNKLQHIIPGLPKIVERVSLRGNIISTLPSPQTSKSLNLPNLRMLDLSKNLLEYIPKFTFQSLGQLRVLSLAYNRLRVLEDLTLLGANKLELLHLQDNLITDLEGNSFQMMLDLRNLNLQGNKIEILPDRIFVNNSRLEQLDLSRNNLHDLPPQIFKNLKLLQFLDLSDNIISEMPESLASVVSIKDIDVSFNHLMGLQFKIVDAWKDIVEIRLSNNQITQLKQGTFMNLPNLQYIDLSSNEIESIESSALKNLPELQEIVLADNKLIEIQERVFENLENVQAVHLQHNQLKFISSEAFYNSPTLVYLNLSENNFHNMDNAGLKNMKNLEVLDISDNKLRTINTMPLKVLNWLVELKMDNNKICKINGTPFETMPRLRVLSIKNNQLKTMHEKVFKKLRGNIAVLDIEGNPIQCNCEMQWLSVWLDETNSPNPGPKCQNGKLLRASRLDQKNCGDYRSSNYLPLFNDHGDYFTRQIKEDIVKECEIDLILNEASQIAKQKPLPGETEYFYDQYIDYPMNDSTTFVDKNSAIVTETKTPGNIILEKTLLNFNAFNKTKQPFGRTPTFTFFGYPLPTLGFGRLFGTYSRNLENKAREQQRSNLGVNSNRPKVRMFKPTDAEFEKYLKGESQYPDISTRNSNRHKFDINSGDIYDTEDITPINFMTGTFKNPTNVEKGGFLPIFPERIGGFIPVLPNNLSVQIVDTKEQTYNQPDVARDQNVKEHKISNNPSIIPLSEVNGIVQQNDSTLLDSKDEFLKIELTSQLPESGYTQNIQKVLPTYFVTENPNSNETVLSTISYNTPKVFEKKIYYENEGNETDSLTEDIFPATSTSETILLIPPIDEQQELSLKSHTWSTGSGQVSENEDEYRILPSARSKITKVFEQNYNPDGVDSTLTFPFTNKQPTAEEYFRTPQPNTELQTNSNDNKLQFNEFVANTLTRPEDPVSSKKHGMEWYYENYKNSKRYYEAEIETAKSRSKPVLRSKTSQLIDFSCYTTKIFLTLIIIFY